MLRFRLKRRARVVFTIVELSPVCRVVGSFGARGRAGVNRIAFRGKVHGKPLEPGTYEITGRTQASGTLLRLVLVVVGGGKPTPDELERARSANVCALQSALSPLSPLSPPAASDLAAVQFISKPAESASTSGSRKSGASPGPVAESGSAQTVAPFTPPRVGGKAMSPLVIASFVVAMLLLTLAAIPQAVVPDPRLTHLITSHRVEIALAGATALAAALLALALG